MGNALSRFQYLPKPVMEPGQCICCGSANKPVIDFGKSDDWYGAVYFCRDCVVEAAMQTGEVVTRGDYEELEQALLNAHLQTEPVLDLIRKHHDQQRDLADRFFDDLTAIHLGRNVSDDEDVNKDSNGDEPNVPVDDPGEPETSGQKSRTTKHKGSVSVPSDPDDVLGLG